MKHARLLPLAALSALLTAFGGDPEPPQYGPDPQLPDPRRGLLPAMKIANPAEWGDQRPTVPQGYTIAAIATVSLGAPPPLPSATRMSPLGKTRVWRGI